MNAQNRFTTDHIRIIDRDPAIETTGAEQRRVEHVRAIRCRQNDDALILRKAVHFNQQLVQRLFAFVMAAAQARAALTTQPRRFRQ